MGTGELLSKQIGASGGGGGGGGGRGKEEKTRQRQKCGVVEEGRKVDYQLPQVLGDVTMAQKSLPSIYQVSDSACH